MLANYSVVVDGLLAGCALPGLEGRLEEDLRDLLRQGVVAMVSLTEDGLPEEPVRRAGLRYLRLPVEDFTTPTLDQIERFVAFVNAEQQRGEGLVVTHCHAGRGRTGTMLAAYLVFQGFSAGEAIDQVRMLRPGSIETWEQERIIMEYERHLRGA